MDDIQFQRKYSSFVQPNYSVTGTQTTTQTGTDTKTSASASFSDLLQQQQQLVFSKHAQQRVDSRQITISPQMLTQMNNAVQMARAKGIQDALIIQDKTAFIVNVPSSTVVTALTGEEMSSHVFSNIDGAVIV